MHDPAVAVLAVAVAVAVAVAAAVLVWLPDADVSSREAWLVLAVALVKTVMQAVASYVMRAKLDGSAVPTPLPPEYPGQPADADPTH